MDRKWPDLDSEWSQWDLHAYVRQMGINPDPLEIIPQGVKYIVWPQPKPTKRDIELAKEIVRKLEAGEIKPLMTIKRRRDPRRN
jgi:hypothetical protein